MIMDKQTQYIKNVNCLQIWSSHDIMWTKILTSFFMKRDKIILKLIWNSKALRITKILPTEKNKVWGFACHIFRFL